MIKSISRGFQILAGAAIGVQIGIGFSTPQVTDNLFKYALIFAALAVFLLVNLIVEDHGAEHRVSRTIAILVPLCVTVGGAISLFTSEFSPGVILSAVTVWVLLVLWLGIVVIFEKGQRTETKEL